VALDESKNTATEDVFASSNNPEIPSKANDNDSQVQNENQLNVEGIVQNENEYGGVLNEKLLITKLMFIL
jgi:hypothetical protein